MQATRGIQAGSPEPAADSREREAGVRSKPLTRPGPVTEEIGAALGRAEALSLATCELTLGGIVVGWSPAAEKMFGWSAAETVGQNVPMVPPQERADLKLLLSEAAAGHAASDWRSVWVRKDGLPLEVSVSVAPVHDARRSVQRVVLTALDISARRVDEAQLQAYARDVRESFAREQRRAQELAASYVATVKALAAGVEAKDGYTGGHIRRVHDMGLLLARAICPEEAGDPQMAYGFLLHDIGKLSVPDAILTKPGKLTPEEWAQIKRHPDEGVRILRSVPFLDRALDVVLHHHERFDGSGYPAGLAGEEIPLWARIFAVVDSLDAMTSDRPYREALSLEEAIAEVRAGAGKQFDPGCVEALAGLERAELAMFLQRRSEGRPWGERG
jgi:PAS domain S-box-containing protein